MCCEQDECALVVFNEVEAVCYLKNEGARATTLTPATGISTYSIDSREGDICICINVSTCTRLQDTQQNNCKQNASSLDLVIFKPTVAFDTSVTKDSPVSRSPQITC